METVCGFTCDIFDKAMKFPNQKQTFLRQLSEYELELVVDGDGETRINGKAYRLTPGMFICARPGETRISRIDKFRCYFIHCSLPTDSPYLDVLHAAPNVFRLIDAERYRAIFEDLIHHDLGHPEGADPDYLTAKMLELFYFIRRDTPRNLHFLEQYADSDKEFITKAIRFMKDNYEKPIHLCDIAQEIGYSPNYFHHVFTSVMGITPQKYLSDIRIRRAKEELVRTQKPLIDIALDCGFSSQSYFDMQFRRATLLTPYQYRKSHIERYGAAKEVSEG